MACGATDAIAALDGNADRHSELAELRDHREEAAVIDHDAAIEPARLCAYLYDVTQAFSEMYDKCSVIDAEPATRASRLGIVDLAGRTLARGLDLLGISAPDRM